MISLEEIEKFREKRVLVVGDLMLDKYKYTEVLRISPEAPVIVAKYKKEKNFLGGAANVAKNLKDICKRVDLVGVIGKDKAGKELLRLLKKVNINREGIFLDDRPTTIKERIVSEEKNQQLLRIDYETTDLIPDKIRRKIIKYIKKRINTVDALVVSDYAKGVLNFELIKKIINISKDKNIPSVVDGKPKNISGKIGATLITPNMKEAIEIAEKLTKKNLGEENLMEVGDILVEKLGSNIFLTMGKKGILIVDKEKNKFIIPGKKVEIADVTGAGDTVAAISALALSSGLELKKVAYLANLAASLVVQKPGTSSCTLEEIKNALNLEKIYLKPEIHEKVWGYEDWIINSFLHNFCGKKLIIKRGYQSSLHYHKIKKEVFYVNKGFILLEVDKEKKVLKPNDRVFIKPYTLHRFTGLTDAEIIEFSTFHTEEDSYRKTKSKKLSRKEFEKILQEYKWAMK